MLKKKKELHFREFPGDPGVRTQHFHCHDQGSISGQKTKPCTIWRNIIQAVDSPSRLRGDGACEPFYGPHHITVTAIQHLVSASQAFSMYFHNP